MLPLRHLLAGLLLLAGLFAAQFSVRAGTYHTCAGVIDTLPATIIAPTVAAMRSSLDHSGDRSLSGSSRAIPIPTNNGGNVIKP